MARSRTTERIVVEKNFRGFQASIDNAARVALDMAGDVAEVKIREHMTRVTPGAPAHDKDRHTRDSIFRIKGVGRTRRGWVVSVISPQPNALWQERGTHAHKGRPKRKSTAEKRKAAGIVSGVKPLRFFRKGLAEAFPDVIREMKRVLDRGMRF